VKELFINSNSLAKILNELFKLRKNVNVSLFQKMSHSDLIISFRNKLSAKEIEPILETFYITHSIKEEGVDIIIIGYKKIKIGIQIKTHKDILEKDFIKKIKSQIFDSRAHRLNYLFIFLCADNTHKTIRRRINILNSEISLKKVIENVGIIEPEFVAGFLLDKIHKEEVIEIADKYKISKTPSKFIQANYYILNDISYFKRILKNNFEMFQLEGKVFMHHNFIFEFINKIAALFDDYFPKRYFEKSYKSEKEILKDYPELSDFQWGLEYKINLSKSELLKTNCYKDNKIVQLFYENGNNFERYGKCYINADPCGGMISKEIELKNINPTFLVLKNITDFRINTIKIYYIQFVPEKLFQIYDYQMIKNKMNLPEKSLKIDNIALFPGDNLIIPIGLFLEPFELFPLKSFKSKESELGRIEKVDLLERIPKGYQLFGPFYFPRTIEIENQIEKIHEFDKQKLFFVNEQFRCGSCPHLFIFDREENKWKYWGEILNPEKPASRGKKSVIKINNNISGLKIVEIEDEESYIDKLHLIKKDNIKILNVKRKLSKNQQLIIWFDENYDFLEIYGYYSPYYKEVFDLQKRYSKKYLIARYLGDLM